MLIHTKVLLALSTSIARGAAQLHTVIWEQETNKHRFVTVQMVDPPNAKSLALVANI